MHEYLIQHNIYIKPHAGGFAHGLQTSFLGHFDHEHPAFANKAA